MPSEKPFEVQKVGDTLFVSSRQYIQSTKKINLPRESRAISIFQDKEVKQEDTEGKERNEKGTIIEMKNSVELPLIETKQGKKSIYGGK